MRISKSRVLLAGFLLLTAGMSTGCASVIQKIQQTTGNEIEKVDNLTLQQQEQAKEENPDEGEKDRSIPKSPSPHTELQAILNDDGQGRYAGKNYERNEVINALQQMPKGLSDDKAYAYLLGLVGENYKEDVQAFDALTRQSYKAKSEAWRNVKDRWLQAEEAAKKSKTGPENKKMNYVVLLDTSGSMGGKLEEEPKMDAVKKSLQQLAKRFPQNTVDFQLRIYGHEGSPELKDRDRSCNSTQKIYAGSRYDQKQLEQALSRVQPTGYNPLALALFKSQPDMKKGAPGQVENHVILITDGYDNCDGNPEKMAQALHLSDTAANVHVIGLDVEAKTEQQLRNIADQTGGDYATVKNEQELEKVLASETDRLKEIGQPWAIRAINAVQKAHHYDEERLQQYYADMQTKVDRESDRLKKANHFIKDDQKIDQRTFQQIRSWIEQRNEQLQNYVRQRFDEVGNKLDEDYRKEVSGLLKDWKEAGGDPDQIELKTEQLIKEDLQDQVKRNMQLNTGEKPQP
jgi:Ca-activated chloride channel homolog